ncbi:FliM/FliN family flagellar motor C-terminal domain-containing protein [Roseateles sp.]|uniref:FliM/FliN family flagellar motor C-terminal domain-containing protein n=1 Tax=Roseateles sp. TaxID=1971397 RepID=UPI0025E05E60|nr:FliM/FliN family flagellar motor C-terminal domain-containing protein [Roseateles sp.]MBV8036787.1 FliM/FliN family flagellar motor switch protein [Roseateles sp.]
MSPPAPPTAPAVLDPRTLGRPVHLLPQFTGQLREALGDLLRQHNRRYRAHYQVGEVSLAPGQGEAGRWLVSDSAQGRMSCLLERSLVQSLMAHRYGATPTAVANAQQTATEERLQALLCRQMLGCAQQALGQPATDLALHHSPLPGLAPGSWMVRAAISEPGQGLASTVLIGLDSACMDRLLRRLADEQPPRAPRPRTAPPQALARRLDVKLQARLLQQTLSLGELLDLRPGDLVPVRLNAKATQVLVDGSCLFTASVAEHQGKLCLTSFADAD